MRNINRNETRRPSFHSSETRVTQASGRRTPLHQRTSRTQPSFADQQPQTPNELSQFFPSIQNLNRIMEIPESDPETFKKELRLYITTLLRLTFRTRINPGQYNKVITAFINSALKWRKNPDPDQAPSLNFAIFEPVVPKVNRYRRIGQRAKDHESRTFSVTLVLYAEFENDQAPLHTSRNSHKQQVTQFGISTILQENLPQRMYEPGILTGLGPVSASDVE